MRRSVLVALLVVGAAGGAAWWFATRPEPRQELVLYGNVDLRQIALAFDNSERISEVLAEEGDRVRRGEVLARLDTRRLEPRAAEAEAQVAAQRKVVERLHNGSRPEEVAQARANVESAQADLVNARRQYERLKSAWESTLGRATTQRDLENGEAALASAEARLEVEKKTLELVLAGPRQEEVQEAEARLRGLEAQLALRRRELADAELKAPADTVVRSRILEAGEMSSPQKPVFSLAVVDPKWVRAYVSEPDLARVRPGLAGWVGVDGFPTRRFDGSVGFVSPVAEFTPKTIQTEELRTSLVYEVRILVHDPADELRLGMPATVHLPLESAPAAGGAAPVASSAAAGARERR